MEQPQAGLSERLSQLDQRFFHEPSRIRRLAAGAFLLCAAETAVAMNDSFRESAQRDGLVMIESTAVVAPIEVGPIIVPSPTSLKSPEKTTIKVVKPLSPKLDKAPVKQETPEIPKPDDREMSPQHWLKHGEAYLNEFPTIRELSKTFPNSKFFMEPERLLAHIETLRQSAQLVTAEDYRVFKMDTTYSNGFVGVPSYDKKRIRPVAYVNHWTGQRYVAGVPQFIASQRNQKTRSTDFFSRDGRGFQVFSGFDRYGQHAKGANLWTAGGEFETETFNPSNPGQRSPLLDINPALTKAMILRNVDFCLKMGYKPSRTRNVSHAALDAIVRNPTYNPRTGKFSKASNGFSAHMNKYDFPQEYMDMVVREVTRVYNEVLTSRR